MEENKNNEKIKKDLLQNNDLFNKAMKNINYSVSGPSYDNDMRLLRLQDEIDSSLYSEMQSVKDFSGEDVSQFIVSLFDSQKKARKSTGSDTADLESLFNLNKGEVLDFFHERYRNRFYLYDDLRMISENLYELREAVNTTRDAIVTSDDNTSLISATRQFKNIIDDENIYMSNVEKIEEDFKLPLKIKNHIIPKTLQYGEYFVYTMPYSKICEKYANIPKDERLKNSSRKLSESYVESDFNDLKNKILMEASLSKMSVADTNRIKNNFNNDMKKTLDRFTVCNDEITKEILTEGGGIAEIQEFISQEKLKQNFKPQKQKYFQDGAQDVNQTSRDDFSNIKGCFIKLLTPLKMIPIEIMNNVTIGYIYVFDSNSSNNNNFMSGAVVNKRGMLSGTGTMTTFLDNMVTTNKDIEYDMVSKIADKIINSFNKKFLEDNEKFKNLIISTLWFNDLYKKNVSFQFIPAEYVTRFTVNEDDEGNGVSILNDALFYAKLYLALLLFKIMSIINKSNDTRIYYIRNSGIDTDVINKVQDVARQIKSRQMSFLDLMDCNSMTTKIGANKEIFIPTGSSGEKSIDFDIMSGQDIQLENDLMERLRKNFINATGVPDVIMDYVNAADYAKTLVMANSKFVARIVSLQLDFNRPITELYKKLLRFCTDLEDHIIDKFEYILNPPRDLNINNMADRINNVDNVIKVMLDATFGVESDQSDERKMLRDELYKELIKKELPSLPWSLLTEQYSDLVLKVKKRVESEKLKNNDGGGDNNSEY